jgi:hypothetical protein
LFDICILAGCFIRRFSLLKIVLVAAVSFPIVARGHVSAWGNKKGKNVESNQAQRPCVNDNETCVCCCEKEGRRGEAEKKV